jgi:hypothetical protein
LHAVQTLKAFLVRESTKRKGELALSIQITSRKDSLGKAVHFIIVASAENPRKELEWSVEQGEAFLSVIALIKYFINKKKSVSRKSADAKLVTPVAREGFGGAQDDVVYDANHKRAEKKTDRWAFAHDMARCAFSGRNLHSRMPLVPRLLA